MKRMIAIGVFTMLAGMLLRFNADTIAWPSQCGYSGPREQTVWAIREAAIRDIGMGLFHLGGILIIGVMLIPCFSSRSCRTSVPTV